MFQFAVTGVYSSNKSFLIYSEDTANLTPFIILRSHIAKTLTPTNIKN